MNTITTNLNKIRAEISQAEQQFHRVPDSVKLLAVSKGQGVEKITEAIAAGQFCFGENYLQEAIAKITALQNNKIEWHFIGVIQSNKTKLIAENFDWVHSVANKKIAERLSTQRSAHLAPLNVCIEVNIDEQTSKSGVKLTEIAELAERIQELPHLQLRGLMAIPAYHHDFITQREIFRRLQQTFLQLQANGFAIDTLSMGMSQDFVAAIAEGSTIVRIGTAIFGART